MPKAKKKKYSLLIFDFDGTLVDSEPLSEMTLHKTLVEMGVTSYTSDMCSKQFMGMSFKDTASFIAKEHPQISEKAFMQNITTMAGSIIDGNLFAIPGAIELLQQIQVCDKCIASNGERQNIIKAMQNVAIDKYFTHEQIFTYKDAGGKSKPDPDLFLYAANQMGGYYHDQCLVLEDSTIGFTAAHEARMDFVAVIPSGKKNAASIEQGAMSMGALGIIRDLKELSDYITEL